VAPRDITAVAATNSARRRADTEALIRTDPAGLLARFHGLASRSTFGTNVFAAKVLAYKDEGAVIDTRSFYVYQAGGDIVAGAKKFAAGAWTQRREAFEDVWKGGRQFVYGALNAGGYGVDSYGEFCLIEDDPSARSPDALAVFPDDSAGRYTSPPAIIDEALACDEATGWAHRADLVTIERAAEVGADESAWPSLICDDRYFEVIVVPGPPLDRLSEVRLKATYATELDDLQARYLTGDVLTYDELNQVAAYDVIQSWRRSGTAITEVD